MGARWVVLCVLVAMGCGEGSPSAGPDERAQTQAGLGGVRLRLMAGNLSSGNKQSYDPGEGARILRGLKPDVAMLQELNVGANAPADLRAFVDTICGTDCGYARGAPAQIPNGIVSRYPILASGDWTDPMVGNRAFTWARIDVPGPADLWAVSVHLLTTSSTNRQLEAQALVGFITGAVPAGDYVVIAGDFNTSSRGEPALTTLSQVVVTAGPWPVDRLGDGDTNSTRSKPYDWVVVSPGLAAHATPTVVGSSSFPDGLVADTRVYAPLEELAPALATDSAAVNMQHMGVVRDFDLPSAPPASVHVDAPNGGERFDVGSSQVVRWTASGVPTVDVDYAADGVTFARIASGVDATLGAIGWSVPAPATAAGVVRVSSGTVSDVSDAPFTVAAVVVPAQVRLNEILANEPGSSTGSEFVELYNAGGSAADLSGWTLSDGAAARHVFAAGTTLAPGATVVVFASKSAIPAGLSNAVGSSTGALSLGNTGDSVTIADATGAVVDSFTYGAALASVDGVSMNRSPDRSVSGAFVLHTALSTLQSSPGRAAVGSP